MDEYLCCQLSMRVCGGLHQHQWLVFVVMHSDRIGMPDDVLGLFAQKVIVFARSPQLGNFIMGKTKPLEFFARLLLGLLDHVFSFYLVFQSATQGALGFCIQLTQQ